jgi:hypothetical protein
MAVSTVACLNFIFLESFIGSFYYKINMVRPVEVGGEARPFIP